MACRRVSSRSKPITSRAIAWASPNGGVVAVASYAIAWSAAFLVFGPMFDLKLFWLYGLIFRRRFVILLSLGLFAAIWFICWRIAFIHP